METPFSRDTLYFLFQLDSADEQTAAIRRELDSRAQKIAEMEKVNTIHTKKKKKNNSPCTQEIPTLIPDVKFVIVVKYRGEYE